MLIGRKYESDVLLKLLDKRESQFCVVYGRRRVGKTYLIRETYNYNFTFQHSGVANGSMKEQLAAFRESLRLFGLKKCPLPKNWLEAFDYLYDLIEQAPEGKKVIFIDELPWMDTARSSMLNALEFFWNACVTARRQQDVVLVVCGSATSWITNKIINNHGGLHNRLTEKIYLKPFSLAECEQFAKAAGLVMERRDVANAYMVLGGIPYYWSFLDKSYSLSQNIDRLFFADSAKLKGEFEALYKSLFKKPDAYIDVIKALNIRKKGLTRNEIIKQTGLADSGDLSTILSDLERCGFIRSYKCYGLKEKNELFQLIDNFTLFHFNFIAGKTTNDPHFWSNSQNSSEVISWQGLAFERLCLLHVEQIKRALEIAGVMSNVCSWNVGATDEHEGAQIDLLIDRKDKVINLCEMKYSTGKFHITKDVADSLNRKLSVFKQVTGTKSAIHLTMVTANGLEHSGYWNMIQNEITLNDLFV